MGAMKHYFNYEVYFECGIPSVTLKGTLADWLNIRERVKKFGDYGLDEWSLTLGYIIDNFISSFKGSPDVTFWN